MALRNGDLFDGKEGGEEDELLGGEAYEELPVRSLVPSRSIIEDDNILGGGGGDKDFGQDGEDEPLGSKEDIDILDCREGDKVLGWRGG